MPMASANLAKAVADNDVKALKKFARRTNGFQTAEIRRKVWPLILGVNRYETVEFRSYQRSGEHSDDSQIRCDVDRSMWSVSSTTQWNDSLRSVRRNALYHIIRAIISRNSSLHYYQGFHDVVSIFVLVLEDDYLAFQVAERVATVFLADCMREDFVVISEVMRFIFPLLEASDPEVTNVLKTAGIEPYFVVSWLLTWFSHDVKDLGVVSRIFDVMLCSHPLYCLYMCAALVVENRDEILTCENDFGTLHTCLVHMPRKDPLSVEVLIVTADALLKRCPPANLVKKAEPDARERLRASGVYFAKVKIPTSMGGVGGWIQRSPVSVPAAGAALGAVAALVGGKLISSWGWTSDEDTSNSRKGEGRRGGVVGSRASRMTLESSVYGATSTVTWPEGELERHTTHGATPSGKRGRGRRRLGVDVTEGVGAGASAGGRDGGKRGGRGRGQPWTMVAAFAAVGGLIGVGVQKMMDADL